jgi:hypothetical protein
MSPARRIRQLETCLSDVLRWCSNREIELNSQGADNNDNENYRELRRLHNRVRRTYDPRRSSPGAPRA